MIQRRKLNIWLFLFEELTKFVSMPAVKRNIANRDKKHKVPKGILEGEVVFITKTEVSVKETLFPEKLKKVNKMLKRAVLLTS